MRAWLPQWGSVGSPVAARISPRPLPHPHHSYLSPPRPFAGTIWGTSAANVPRVFALFTETLRYMISQGAVDQDQAVIAHMYKRDPAAFDSFYTVGEWNTVLRDF